MKLLATIGLRLLGIALVAFVLIYQVEYRDHLVTADGTDIEGRIERDGADVAFHADDGDVTALGPEWRNRKDLRLGLFTIVAHADKSLLLLGLLLYGPITLLSISRWWYLLRTVGLPIPFVEAFRLTFIGFFFSSVIPGMTGGDLVKGVYIARRESGARTRAFMSVLVDRVIGLFALGVLAGIVLLPNLGDPRFQVPAAIVFVFLGIATTFGVVFLSRRLRGLLRFDALIAKLPFSKAFAEIDRAITIYRDHTQAVLLSILISLANHVSLVFMAFAMGTAIGIDIPLHQYFMLYPVCLMMASIPLLPGGWGVREASFQAFFGMVGVAATQAVALSILVGLSLLGWSLLGGVFFLLSPDRVSRREVSSFQEHIEREIDANS
ncbi:MAG: lysylphosphatidylglycerol synthase transmembrane domain-containing protein [Planctomycetota bacterium]